MYVVMGATGKTGGIVAGKLLAAGKKVRVIGRDVHRLEKFTRQGAEAVLADATDPASLGRAFANASAAYVLVPPNIASPDIRAYQTRVADSIASALKTNAVPHAVVLSSFGADKAEKTGPVIGLHQLEEKLAGVSGLNALFVRAGYFMENLLPQADVIKSFGNMAGPVKNDLPLPMIATCDVGAAVAGSLLSLDFAGKSAQEVQGSRDVTYDEVAKIIGAAIGKPGLRYMQLPNAQLKPFLVQMGMSANMADLLLQMTDALNSGHMRTLDPRSPKNSTPTTVEKFAADVFAPLYRGEATHA